MAYVKNTDMGEVVEIRCMVDGVDIMGDMLGESGVPYDDGWLLDTGDIEWWRDWARREELIHDTLEDATDEQVKAYIEATGRWTGDLGEFQLGLAKALGIEE